MMTLHSPPPNPNGFKAASRVRRRRSQSSSPSSRRCALSFTVLLSLSVLSCCGNSSALSNNNKLENKRHHRLLPEDSFSLEGDNPNYVRVVDNGQQQQQEDEGAPTPTLINDQDKDEDESFMEDTARWIKETEAADVAQYGSMEDELLQNMEEEEIDVTSDAVDAEKTDVQETAQELMKEAESEASSLVADDGDETNDTDVTSSNSYYNNDPNNTKRSAWVAHGTIGAIAFGILVPMTISSGFFRDVIPTYWIYIHVCINVIAFAMAFLTVGIAFATMNSTLTGGGGGHFQEIHHIGGLLLLLIVSFQTANGFLRPPREFITDDEHDKTPGAILRSTMNDKSMTARTLWHLVHTVTGLLVFALGAYQVQSGLGLFAKRFESPDWSSVYTGYIIWLSAVIVAGKLWMKWKERRVTKNTLQFQLGRGGNLAYDPENDFAVAQFETV